MLDKVIDRPLPNPTIDQDPAEKACELSAWEDPICLKVLIKTRKTLEESGGY